jgi:hypothetical protein
VFVKQDSLLTIIKKNLDKTGSTHFSKEEFKQVTARTTEGIVSSNALTSSLRHFIPISSTKGYFSRDFLNSSRSGIGLSIINDSLIPSPHSGSIPLIEASMTPYTSVLSPVSLRSHSSSSTMEPCGDESLISATKDPIYLHMRFLHEIALKMHQLFKKNKIDEAKPLLAQTEKGLNQLKEASSLYRMNSAQKSWLLNATEKLYQYQLIQGAYYAEILLNDYRIAIENKDRMNIPLFKRRISEYLNEITKDSYDKFRGREDTSAFQSFSTELKYFKALFAYLQQKETQEATSLPSNGFFNNSPKSQSTSIKAKEGLSFV